MLRSILVAAAVAMSASGAHAIGSSHCIALAQSVPGAEYLHPAALGGETGLAEDEVRIRFIGHATFLIETATGYRIATDFTGYAGPDITPDIVTMNRAHTSHYTDYPDPQIPHVLRGWGEDGLPADHYLELDGLLVRNVTTDIRSYSGRQKDQNSIFIFEAAGLCIGHLGHLHHEPSDAHYGLIGRLDVVMAPVDGGYTMAQPAMIDVLKRVRASVVLPMHWFGNATLSRFLEGMVDHYRVEREPVRELVVSLATLPREPVVMVMTPGGYSTFD